MKRTRHNLTKDETARWQAAKDAGLPTWHRDVPCRSCGSTERFVSNRSSCVPCQQRRAREAHKRAPLVRLVKGAKWRAEQLGLDFDLTVEDLVVPDVCPVLGIEMTVPSLDRRNNSLGYTKDNVRVISWKANALKRELSIDQIKCLLKYMED